MAISEPYELDGVTVTATALSIISGNTTPQSVTDDGMYQCWVDGGNMAKADEFEVVQREIVEGTGGVQKTFAKYSLMGVQGENFVTPAGLILINGWDMLIDKLAGTDRAFDASIRKVA